MFCKILLLFLFLFLGFVASQNDDFTYNGFRNANISLDGTAEITGDGLLKLTNTTRELSGHAFHSIALPFKNSSTGNSLSFSTTFVFTIIPAVRDFSGSGMAFAVSPTRKLTGAAAAQYLGLSNSTSDGNSANHIFAVELDTIQNDDVGDADDNHVGIDINGVRSKKSSPAGYFATEDGRFRNLSLQSSELIQAWVEYDGIKKQLNVTLCPSGLPKPTQPLISMIVDLSPVILDTMYVGFSSATGPALVATHYVLGWSFKMNGVAKSLDHSRLPKLPRMDLKERSKFLTYGLPVTAIIFAMTIAFGVGYMVRRKIRVAEVLEDWESEFKPSRFSYKELFIATKGFKESELLGVGGFGSVYKGLLLPSYKEVAVKRVCHESQQGMREFVTEIVSLGRLCHRNLVKLLGYCRRRGELLLVYEFMPNGSLDKFLFNETKTLSWAQRFQIVKGVASGLLYLHEEWEQVVIHRDIKASNVLLDGDLNGRLGDFGFARMYDRGTDPQTTSVVGTIGYLAPELARTGRVSTATDIFAFGAFLLEVACGRRPINPHISAEGPILVDLVSECWKRGAILEAMDPKLESDCVEEEIELVLKLGLLCSHPVPAARPSMRQVMQWLDGNASLPELLSDSFDVGVRPLAQMKGFDDIVMPCTTSATSISITESLLSGRL